MNVVISWSVVLAENGAEKRVDCLTLLMEFILVRIFCFFSLDMCTFSSRFQSSQEFDSAGFRV